MANEKQYDPKEAIMTKPLPTILEDLVGLISRAEKATAEAKEAAKEARQAGEKAAQAVKAAAEEAVEKVRDEMLADLADLEGRLTGAIGQAEKDLKDRITNGEDALAKAVDTIADNAFRGDKAIEKRLVAVEGLAQSANEKANRALEVANTIGAIYLTGADLRKQGAEVEIEKLKVAGFSFKEKK